MSKKVRQFILFILDKSTLPIQARLLLQNISHEQVQGLSEIFHNRDLLPLTQNSKAIIKKKKKIFDKIANRKLSIKTRTRLVKTHHRLILNTLNLLAKFLLEFLS